MGRFYAGDSAPECRAEPPAPRRALGGPCDCGCGSTAARGPTDRLAAGADESHESNEPHEAVHVAADGIGRTDAFWRADGIQRDGRPVVWLRSAGLLDSRL